MKTKILCLALLASLLISCNNLKSYEGSTKNNQVSARLPKEKTKPLKTFVSSDLMRHGNLSFYAVDLENGKIIDNYKGDTGTVPASVLKIVTSATAIEVLGADTVLETKLIYDGVISKNGILKGDIYIQGAGDPTLGSTGFPEEKDLFLKEWLEKMQNLGIKSIDGNIIVLDDLFGYEGIPGKWLWEDMGTDYGQATYGISIFDNLYNLSLSSKKSGEKPKIVKIHPKVNNLILENKGMVVEEGKNTIIVQGGPLDNKRVIRGIIPKSEKEFEIESDIPDPGLFLGQYFSEYLKNKNIKLNGKVMTARTTARRPKNGKVIATKKSPTISEICKVLLTRSDNHYAEHLYQLLEKTKNVDIVEFWKNKGLNTYSVVLKDGSGLSRANIVSAKFLV
ncbi:MAG: D-alanyl-D-alanine carboxypeptidase/D-alanyl-D-alanine endopeptidase, partial [Cetobacterium sp.]